MKKVGFIGVDYSNSMPFAVKEESFLCSLRQFLTTQIETVHPPLSKVIYQFCLGTDDLSYGVQERLLQESLEKLPLSFRERILTWYEDNKEQMPPSVFSNALLPYAEKIEREGHVEESEHIRQLVIRWILLPDLLDLDRDVRGGLESCLKKVEEAQKKIEELSCLLAQKIDLFSLQQLIQKIVPKKTLQEDVRRYAEGLLPHLQNFLEKKLFTDCKDYIWTLDRFPLCEDPQDTRKSSIWIHSVDSGVHVVFIPDSQSVRIRVDGLKELSATDLFIPKSGEASQVGTSILLKGDKKHKNSLALELKNRQMVSSLPNAQRYFAPAPIVFLDSFLSKKATEGKNFQSELRSLFYSISAVDILQICQDVVLGVQILAQDNKVSLDIHPENILFKREENGDVLGQIDHFLHLTLPRVQEKSHDKRRNALAKDGYISVETDRYALVLLIAEAFFLSIEEDLTLDKEKWENGALKPLKDLIYDPHYQKILQLKNLHGGFSRDFSKDLFTYIEELTAREEESFQVVALNHFAYKMALFPEISALLLKTLQADAVHQELLAQGKPANEIIREAPEIPQLEYIYEVLQEGKAKIQAIQSKKEPSNCESIPLSSIEQIVERVYLNQEGFDTIQCTRDLYRILYDFLRENPFVGAEIRLHKKTLWKDTLIRVPLSMWVRVQKDSVVLEIFPPGAPASLEVSAYKKAKENIQVTVSKEGDLRFNPVAVARLRNDLFHDDLVRIVKGNNFQELILSIPTAEKYFLGLPKKHASYQVGGKMKQESIYPRFDGTLSSVIKTGSLQTEKGLLNLTTLDFIVFLQKIGRGIQLIAEQGLSHGDIKSQNIAILLEEGLPSPYIFDFDMTSPFSKGHLKSNYWDWNLILQKYGIISEETDVYGYVLMIAESLLFGFKDYLQGTQEGIIHNFQTIWHNSRQENRSMRVKYVEEMQKRFPTLMTQEKALFFSAPPLVPEITNHHEELFHSVKALQEEGKLADALVLKRFLAESLYFEKVFSLLNKTFLADYVSGVDIKGNLETLELEDAAKKALKSGGFPTLDEIQEVLNYCKEAAEEVEFQCAKQETLLESIWGWLGWR